MKELIDTNNQMPNGWTLIKLPMIAGDNGIFCDGDWIESKDQDKDGEIRLIQLADIRDGEFRSKSDRHLTNGKAIELNCTFLKRNDILIARMPEPLGRACIFPLKEENKYVTVVDVCILRVDKHVAYDKFICHIINAPNSRASIAKLESGTTRKRISRINLGTIDFPFPPLPEQHRIVAKIEELFSELDKGEEALKTAQQQLKVYRQAVLKWAFEGKLTEEWRKRQKNLPTAARLVEQIKAVREKQAKVSGKRLKPVVPLTEEELAELQRLPVGWCWLKNEEYLFEVKDGTHDTPKYIERGIPFITQKNIREKGLDFSDIEYISEEDHKKFYQRSDVTKGDIIISMIGHNRGMSAIVETDKVFSIKNVGLFKFFSNLQSNKFSFYYYQSRIGLNIILAKSKGGAQQFIGLTELRNWSVPVCSLDEQHAIVSEIETRLSVADKLEETITHSLQQAEALRQSILKKAFAGKLVPQDPNDEPAAKLLERIKAEKAAQGPVKRSTIQRT